MGYKLTSLANLPVDDTVNMYIYVIGGGGWEGGLDRIIHKNFDKLAADIGEDAVIVGALNEYFSEEVSEKYLGKSHHELQQSLPALLLTDCHPEQLNDTSMRMLIPLKRANDSYPAINQFLAELTSFARGESDELLKSLESNVDPAAAVNEIVKVNIPIIPGIVSVNLNSAVANLRKWWSGKAYNKQIQPMKKTRG